MYHQEENDVFGVYVYLLKEEERERGGNPTGTTRENNRKTSTLYYRDDLFVN